MPTSSSRSTANNTRAATGRPLEDRRMNTTLSLMHLRILARCKAYLHHRSPYTVCLLVTTCAAGEVITEFSAPSWPIWQDRRRMPEPAR